jgi:solute carrier family 25 protein 39/40
MSAHWIRHADSDIELATAFEHQSGLGGRGHDRIHGDNPIPGVSSTIAMTGDMTGDMTGGNDDIEVDITAGQKMMSAMSGSLLTSLLGEWTVF